MKSDGASASGGAACLGTAAAELGAGKDGYCDTGTAIIGAAGATGAAVVVTIGPPAASGWGDVSILTWAPRPRDTTNNATIASRPIPNVRAAALTFTQIPL